MTRATSFAGAFLSVMVLAGCQSAQQHAASVEAANSEAERLTVGTVQREIRVGMSGAEVAAALGSPNIVSTDEYRNEVWIYDKISSHSAQTQTHASPATLLLFDSLAPITATSSNQRNESSQRSLTVIIKFDEDKKVYDFAYHTSRF